MNNKKAILSLLILCLAVQSILGQSRVLISGATSIGNRTVACYWLDGTRFVLPLQKGSTRSEATGIAIQGEHVYVSGTSWVNERATPCIWIDGVQTELPLGVTKKPTRGGNATSVSVQDGNWVVGGFWTNDTTTLPCYWTNGSRHDLQSPGSQSSLGTVVMGSLVVTEKVYTYGFFYEKGSSRACYWIDGEFHNLAISGAKESAAFGLAVQDGEVVIVGEVRLDKKSEAFYWKSGKIETLPSSRSANGIMFQDDQVWVLGFSSENKACFWRNGKYYPLPGEVTIDQGFEARAFSRFGDHVLIAGIRSWDQGYSREAILWDNQSFRSLDSKGSYTTDLTIDAEN